MKRSLLEIGGVDIGQVHNKALNWKPTLIIIRDHEELSKITHTKICNEIWKPMQSHSSPGEKHEDISTSNFMKNQTNGAKTFENSFETVCWACHKEIDTETGKKCPECNFAIKCHCGVCVCDKPNSTVKKLPQYTQNR